MTKVIPDNLYFKCDTPGCKGKLDAVGTDSINILSQNDWWGVIDSGKHYCPRHNPELSDKDACRMVSGWVVETEA